MNILIIYGGRSCEHDISVITACLAKGYFVGNLYSAYFSSENKCYLVPNDLSPKMHKSEHFKQRIVFFSDGQIGVLSGKKIKKFIHIDVAVNCCHGLCGEDGAVAGLCEMADIPLVGSGIVASGVAMDKYVTKLALQALDLPVLPGIRLCDGASSAVDELEFPIILKPTTLGSSIGIALCKNKKQLQQGLKSAFAYDNNLLCEKALTDFFELNCAAMRTQKGVETSDVDRPYTTNDILTFNDKYQRGEKYENERTEVSKELSEKVKNMTAEIYEKLGFSGVVRVDYLFDNLSQQLFVNEINSIPGSLAYGLWQNKYSPKQFGDLLLKAAIAEHAKKSALKRNFDSGVLGGGIYKK